MIVCSGYGSHRGGTDKRLVFKFLLDIDDIHTRVPTVTPAAIEGIEPVLIYPKVPPPAVRAPMMYAGSSMPLMLLTLYARVIQI